ncbi:MAG TPA: hypothetical protein VNZ06_06015 [Steroidobacteraceae bacterium]|jgi:hypothetical protein|nr:hypothetical protein [Steroidobacteraceae bacterium]
MRRHLQTSAIAALGIVLTAGGALAQEIEPGVQTSSAAAPVPKASPPANPAAAAPKPKAAPAPARTAPPNAAPTADGRTKSSDRIELDTTQISGNRELPKVMYVVPWRRADPGDFAGRPPNSLLDEALTPVDRDVFRRQNSYYGAVRDQTQVPAAQSGAAATSGSAATPKDEK